MRKTGLPKSDHHDRKHEATSLIEWHHLLVGGRTDVIADDLVVAMMHACDGR